MRQLPFFVGVALAALAAFSIRASGAGFGPDHLIKIDLRQCADFDRAATMGMKPVFRSGNEFYAVVDGAALAKLTTARLPFVVVETDPFSEGFYYVQSKSVAQKT